MELNQSERASDTQNNRGFSTDQRISIEGLYLQKQMNRQQTAESTMILMIAHERAISRQIESAERRAEMRCKKYDATNMHWKVVDTLLAKQAGITKKMGDTTASFQNNDDMNGVSIVSEFLNEKSPSKRSKNVCSNITNGSNVTNLDSDDIVDSLNMDINKIIGDKAEKDMAEKEVASDVSKE